jgi:chitinase
MTQKARAKLPFLVLLLQNIIPSFAAENARAIPPPEGCATPCKESGSNPVGWTTFPAAADYFQRCSYAPALLTYNLESQDPPTAIRACEDLEDTQPAEKKSKAPPVELERRFCAPPLEFDVEVSRTPANDTAKFIIPGQVMGAAMTIKDSLLQKSMSSGIQLGDGLVMHAHWADAVVGVYIGSGFDKTEFANGPLEDFIQGIQQFGMGQTLQAQSCGRNSSNSASAFGIIADTSGIEALSTIRNAIKLWSKGQCAEILEQVSPHTREILPTRQILSDASNQTIQAGNWTGLGQQLPSNWTGLHDKDKSNTDGLLNLADPQLDINNRLAAYAQNECIATEVQPGDSCGALAQRCQVNPNKFMQINNQPNLCSNLVPGQRVCCSAGELPDIRPKQQPNGECAVYTVTKGEWCAAIASKNGLTLQELESLNKHTWGWNGCERLLPDTKLCVSKGEPPFPIANPNAVCGPTKPGTKRPPGSKSTEWGKLNECPLKACCNIWGNCGTTSDFCVEKSAGPPGSSKGVNGCIGNCGLTILNNQKKPAQFRHIGYFEAWNHNRPCLHMDVEDIPAGKYTHVHFAFPEITNDYKVNMGKLQDQFDKFRNANKGYKRIVAFGGWDFSTQAPTAHIFRNGVTRGNRERLASSLADFVIRNNLDGIDFDWEYPGVPDMNWLPPSSPDEGSNYLEFLKLVRSKLPRKSISIAAPASFWYLKAFPIEKISKVVDYIVYMTYDL